MAKTLKSAAVQAAKLAVDALIAICGNEDARDADRIAAAKLLIELSTGRESGEGEKELRVVLQDVPPEYLK